MFRRLQKSGWFYFACAAEASLGLLAAVLGFFFHQVPWAHFRWSLWDALIGLGASFPPLLLFVGMLKFRPRLLRDVHQALEQTVRPLFGHLSILQLALISIAAGVGEELLFRGFIQEKLSLSLGSVSGLLVASILFGCAHPITANYALVTTVVGAYLGGLMMLTENLMSPILAHAAYDFMALVYFLRVHRDKPSNLPGTEPGPGNEDSSI